MAFQRARGTPRSLNGSAVFGTGNVDIPSSPMSPYGTAFAQGAPAQYLSQTAADALEGARASIEAAMRRDRALPELRDLFQSSTHSGTNYIRGDGPQPVQISPIIPLPEALLEQYDHLECKCFMGIFPTINRAWLTIDNQIFLWNYEDGSDFAVYDGLDQIIVSAALVPPREDVFVERVEHVLVLSTPAEIVMLGIAFEGPQRAELQLLPTQLSVPSDGVNMLCISGASNGRIFMGGRDGCVYELAYQAEDGWFTRRCRKINHSTGKLSVLVPSFLRFSVEDPIVQIAVDSVRRVVYTLSEKSVIQVFDISEEGHNMRLAYRYADIAAEMRTLTTGRGPRHVTVASIAVVSPSESSDVRLVGVTSTGDRLYFSSRARGYMSSADAAHSLQLTHVRRAPSPDVPTSVATTSQQSRTPQARGGDMLSQSLNLSQSGFGSLSQSGFAQRPSTPASQQNVPFTSAAPDSVIHSTLYNDGVLFLADALWEDRDRVTVVVPEIRRTEGGWTRAERPTCLEVSGKTWAIAEAPDASSALAAVSTLPVPELALQHVAPPRRFLLLTNAGMHHVVRLRPVDVLQQALAESGGGRAASGVADTFIRSYGADQFCAMCLILATHAPKALSDSRAPAGPRAPDAAVVHQARQLFFNKGAQLNGDQGGAGPLVGSRQFGAFDMGGLVQSEITCSAAHDGLCLHLARVLRPIWDRSLVDRETLMCGITRAEMASTYTRLRALAQFLDEHPGFVGNEGAFNIQKKIVETADHTRVTQVQEAMKREKNSLVSVRRLVSYCAEGLTLLDTLDMQGISTLAAALPPELREEVARTTFRDMVFSPRLSPVRHLVAAMVERTAAGGTNVDEVSETLGKNCPSYYGRSDAIRHKALECIQRARVAAGGRGDQLRLLKEAADLYASVAGDVDLAEVGRYFSQLSYFEGTVRIALARARAVDPQNLAARDGDARLLDERKVCYGVILGSLTDLWAPPQLRPGDPRAAAAQRDADAPPVDPLLAMSPAQLQQDTLAARERVMSLVLASDDELLHERLYDWFEERGMAQALLDLRTPFLEAYLTKVDAAAATDDSPSNDRRDLLWQYYVRSGSFGQAARILMRLAEKEGHFARLPRRVEYLSLAVSNAKSSRVRAAGAVDGDLLQELEEKLEVARIQLLVNSDIERAVGDDRYNQTVVHEALEALNTKLYTISELYNRFVSRFHLSEAALAVIHCSGHVDPPLVASLWTKIVSDIMASAENGPVGVAIEGLSEKLRSLGARYYPADNVFPVGFLAHLLETKSFEFSRVDPSAGDTWVFEAFLAAGVPFNALFDVYNQLSRAEEVQHREMRIRLLRVILALLSRWVDRALSPSAAPGDRQLFRMSVVGINRAIGDYVIALEALGHEGEAKALVDSYRALAADLESL